MKIYTKTGDRGKTSLFDGTRVAKDNIRLETYGTFDELNSAIGLVIAEISNIQYQISNIKKELMQIQKDIFEIGSYLANPKSKIPSASYFDHRVSEFEKLIDQLTEKLPVLTNFILPGGGKAGASTQLARAISRRAERRLVTLSQKEAVDSSFLRYFNRLSDLLFTMSRFMNTIEKKKEIVWTKSKL